MKKTHEAESAESLPDNQARQANSLSAPAASVGPSAGKPLTIGRLARLAGLGAETLRFYEREGLLEAPLRSSGGYRHYDEQALMRVGFITRAKALGFTLREIRELLDLSNSEQTTAGNFKEIVQSKMAEIESKIADLQSIHGALERLQGCCPGGRVKSARCPILAALEGRPLPRHDSSMEVGSC